MVFEVSGNQQLSQTNVKTMSQRCVELISRAACIDQIRNEVIEPVLQYYAEATPPKTLANDSVFLAWRLLRQGTMLCFLLNNFRSGILSSFNMMKKPLAEGVFSDAEAKANIKQFLAACRNDLYMTDDQLFTEATLYTDDTNTLSKAIALTDNFFLRIGRIQSVNYNVKFDELAKTNKLFSLEAADSDHEVQKKDMDLRLRVIDEILDTEQKYIADLDKLQTYAEELRMDKIITPEAHKAIFGNLDELVDFQRRFLMQMESKFTKQVMNDLAASYKAGIAELFIDNEKGFSNLYETFCPNFQHSSDMVTAELVNLQKKERVMEPNVVLRAYLIKPTQRICKYPLLIREMLKQSIPDAPDRKALEKAFEVVNRVVAHINEKKRSQEMNLAAEELFAQIKDWKGLDKIKFGELVLKETATIVMGENSKELEVYLFDKVMLMIGKSRSMTSKVQPVIKGHIYMSQVVSAVRSATDDDDTFSVKMTYRNVDMEYVTLKFKMEEKAKSWVATLNILIQANRPKELPKQEAPVTPKERRRRSLLAATGVLKPPAPAPNLRPIPEVATKPIPVQEEEPLRLKIHFGDDIYVAAIFTDLETYADLKKAVLSKLKVVHKSLNLPFLLSPAHINLKYYDDQKDLITIVDDSDIDAALTFSPDSLNIQVELNKDAAHISLVSEKSQ